MCQQLHCIYKRLITTYNYIMLCMETLRVYAETICLIIAVYGHLL